MSDEEDPCLLQLPRTLSQWRDPDPERLWEAGVAFWETARPIFERDNVELWRTTDITYQRARPGEMRLSSGFAYLTPQRHLEWADKFKKYNPGERCLGHSVTVRIVAIGNEGKAHKDILRSIARGAPSLRTDNHIVPLWREIQYQDMSFAVFPWVGHCLEESYAPYIENTVGDVADMILQCLEALAYIHTVGIAHRDTDKSNFLVQWHPESLVTMRVPISRPHVYLNDFESAVQLSPGTVTTSMRPSQGYLRNVAPEVSSGGSYEPFKPDVWQFADSFSDYRTTIPLIDEILNAMAEPDPTKRPSSSESRDWLAQVLYSMAPASLLIAPAVESSFSELVSFLHGMSL